MTHARAQAIQAVVDRTSSYQDGAPEGKVEAELRAGFAAAGVDVTDDELRLLAEAIEDRHGAVDVTEVLSL